MRRPFLFLACSVATAMAFAFGCGQPDRGCPFDELCGPPSSDSFDALPGFFGADAADADATELDETTADADDDALIDTDAGD